MKRETLGLCMILGCCIPLAVFASVSADGQIKSDSRAQPTRTYQAFQFLLAADGRPVAQSPIYHDGTNLGRFRLVSSDASAASTRTVLWKLVDYPKAGGYVITPLAHDLSSDSDHYNDFRLTRLDDVRENYLAPISQDILKRRFENADKRFDEINAYYDRQLDSLSMEGSDAGSRQKIFADKYKFIHRVCDKVDDYLRQPTPQTLSVQDTQLAHTWLIELMMAADEVSPRDLADTLQLWSGQARRLYRYYENRWPDKTLKEMDVDSAAGPTYDSKPLLRDKAFVPYLHEDLQRVMEYLRSLLNSHRPQIFEAVQKNTLTCDEQHVLQNATTFVSIEEMDSVELAQLVALISAMRTIMSNDTTGSCATVSAQR